MTANTPAGRILGRLASVDQVGVVRIQDQFDTDVEDLWSAITDPARLGGWYGDVAGDLRVGGEFSLHIEADGWDGRGRVQECDPPRQLRVTTRESDESWQEGQGAPPFDQVIAATLSAEGERTLLVLEIAGLPLDKIHFYGAGWQIHAENLAAYLEGRDRGDTEARWDELVPAYQEMVVDLD